MGMIQQAVLSIESNSTYQISYTVTVIGGQLLVDCAGGRYINYIDPVVDFHVIDTFTTIGLVEGSPAFSWIPQIGVTSVILDNVSLKKLSHGIDDHLPVKEFLTGDVDGTAPIFFRADTQILQIQPNPEMYSIPIAIATETERGSQLKAFVSIDDKPFYQLEGTITKDISILKTDARSDEEVTPPLVHSIQLSFRDSSKNRCRVVQTAIITTPTSIDYSQ